MSDDRHRCLARSLCRASVVEDGRKQPALTESPDMLCPPCIRSVVNAVEDLPMDYAALHLSLGEHSPQPRARVKATPDPPLPIDQHKFALMEAISSNLDRAAEIVSDALHCDPPQGKIAPRLSKASVMVSTNINHLLESGDVAMWDWERCDPRCGRNGCEQGEHLRLTDKSGVQLAGVLRDLHRRARAALEETEKLIRLPMVCGSCGAPHVFQRPDSDVIFCKDCNWDATEKLHAFAGRLSKQRQAEMELADMESQERAEVWLAAEKLWLRAQAAENVVEQVRKVARLSTDEAARLENPVGSLLRFLREITGETDEHAA